MRRSTVRSATAAALMALAVCAGGAPPDAADEARLDDLADCAAYFFIAARADAISRFEQSYRAGEFSYNLLVATLGKEAAQARFNAANERVVESMSGAWTRFEDTRARFGERCRRLEERAASDAGGARQP